MRTDVCGTGRLTWAGPEKTVWPALVNNHSVRLIQNIYQESFTASNQIKLSKGDVLRYLGSGHYLEGGGLVQIGEGSPIFM